MNAREAKEAIQALALSQDFYKGFFRVIEEHDDSKAVYTQIGEGCDDEIDLILKIECYDEISQLNQLCSECTSLRP